MSLFKTVLVVALGFAVQVASHGHVTSVSCTGKTTPAFDPYPDAWASNPTCSWRDHGIIKKAFIASSEYATGDINCHVGATPADLDVEVIAGQEITMQWTNWPVSHHGPVITYLGACNGDCRKVNLNEVKWNKIDEEGQISVGKTDSDAGVWAADKLRENGNKATVKIPESIKAGNYLCRHEIIFLNADIGKTQHYPNCINLKVSGSGTDPLPSGTKGVDLYSETDPSIHVMVYGKTLDYKMPGPALYARASASGGTDSNSDSGKTTPDDSATTTPDSGKTTPDNSGKMTPDSGKTTPDDSGKTTPTTHTPTGPGKSPNTYGDAHLTPYATGTVPSYSSVPTGTKPHGYQPEIGSETPKGSNLTDSTTPKTGSEASESTEDSSTKADGKTSEPTEDSTTTDGDEPIEPPEDSTTTDGDEDSTTTNGDNDSTNPTSDAPTTPKSQYASSTTDETSEKPTGSDVKVPDGASFSQYLDVIDRAVQAIRKALSSSTKHRRHARDVTA
ncbi:hypothetical protein MMC07_008546 [Pseudocyphellaria aurata]|nr:hypothetical protein [Pseudocyphellaria aurata]